LGFSDSDYGSKLKLLIFRFSKRQKRDIVEHGVRFNAIKIKRAFERYEPEMKISELAYLIL